MHISCIRRVSRHPLCWCHEKNADYCPQIDTTVLVVCGMLRRPLYCIIWAWLLHPNESSSFRSWLFMPPKLSFVSWHWTFSRHLFGVLIHIFSSGIRRTIGLWIVDCCVMFSFFWLHHQLENAFHLLFAGFDGILGGCRLSSVGCQLSAGGCQLGNLIYILLNVGVGLASAWRPDWQPAPLLACETEALYKTIRTGMEGELETGEPMDGDDVEMSTNSEQRMLASSTIFAVSAFSWRQVWWL